MKHYDVESYGIDNSVGYLLRRGASLMREQLETAFADAGLTFVQWVTLSRVSHDPSLTPGELCRDLRHDSGAFTRILDHLEHGGLIRRTRSDQDRRVVELQVTPAGQRAVDALRPLVVERLNHALADFSAADVATLTALLKRLIARLETAPPGGAGSRGPAP